ncbi:MAG TPA: DUF2231 domain-containing protein [Stenomitos sp.]
MTLASLHPLVVHFPIALLISALAFDLVGVLWKREAFTSAGFYAQVLGALGAIASVITGNQAEEAVEDLKGLAETLETHERLGQISMWATLLAVIVRGYLIRRAPLGPRLRAAMLVVSLALALLVAASGFYGGKLVYEFGAGTDPVMRTLSPEAGR